MHILLGNDDFSINEKVKKIVIGVSFLKEALLAREQLLCAAVEQKGELFAFEGLEERSLGQHLQNDLVLKIHAHRLLISSVVDCQQIALLPALYLKIFY